MVLSSEHEAMRAPSGEYLAHLTQLVWPEKEVTNLWR